MAGAKAGANRQAAEFRSPDAKRADGEQYCL
jgi:hypothetical protein